MKPDETASDGVTECNSMTSSEGCNRCNGYTSLHRPKTGKNENPLSRDEVKQVYLELRTNGITPTIRILRDHFKRGSFSTLQKYVSELNGTYTDAKLSELQRSRVPDKVMAQMIERGKFLRGIDSHRGYYGICFDSSGTRGTGKSQNHHPTKRYFV